MDTFLVVGIFISLIIAIAIYAMYSTTSNRIASHGGDFQSYSQFTMLPIGKSTQTDQSTGIEFAMINSPSEWICRAASTATINFSEPSMLKSISFQSSQIQTVYKPLKKIKLQYINADSITIDIAEIDIPWSIPWNNSAIVNLKTGVICLGVIITTMNDEYPCSCRFGFHGYPIGLSSVKTKLFDMIRNVKDIAFGKSSFSILRDSSALVVKRTQSVDSSALVIASFIAYNFNSIVDSSAFKKITFGDLEFYTVIPSNTEDFLTHKLYVITPNAKSINDASHRAEHVHIYTYGNSNEYYDYLKLARSDTTDIFWFAESPIIHPYQNGLQLKLARLSTQSTTSYGSSLHYSSLSWRTTIPGMKYSLSGLIASPYVGYHVIEKVGESNLTVGGVNIQQTSQSVFIAFPVEIFIEFVGDGGPRSFKINGNIIRMPDIATDSQISESEPIKALKNSKFISYTMLGWNIFEDFDIVSDTSILQNTIFPTLKTALLSDLQSFTGDYNGNITSKSFQTGKLIPSAGKISFIKQSITKKFTTDLRPLTQSFIDFIDSGLISLTDRFYVIPGLSVNDGTLETLTSESDAINKVRTVPECIGYLKFGNSFITKSSDGMKSGKYSRADSDSPVFYLMRNHPDWRIENSIAQLMTIPMSISPVSISGMFIKTDDTTIDTSEQIIPGPGDLETAMLTTVNIGATGFVYDGKRSFMLFTKNPVKVQRPSMTMYMLK